MATQAQSQAQLQAQAAAANQMASNLITSKAVRMRQQIFSQTVVPANQPFIDIQPRYVGLLMGFWVKVTATVHNSTGGGTAITPTNFGAANILSQIKMNDLNNLDRILTQGWHINFLNSIKGRGAPYATAILNSAFDGINATGAYGSNWVVISQTASIADGANGTVNMWYYVPAAYSDMDYRGSIFINTVNATMRLTLTFNTIPVGNSGADTTTAVYAAASGAGSISSATVTVYQDYLDQLPQANGQFVLPQLSLSTIYEMKYTLQTAIAANVDFPVQYANFRDFLSTVAIYNHDPTSSTGRTNGGDINYWGIQAANMTFLTKVEPALVALWTRAQIHTDLPLGVYYFSSRMRPISTSQYGNMQLVLNAITAATGAYMLVGYENFGIQSVITQAGSLPAS